MEPINNAINPHPKEILGTKSISIIKALSLKAEADKYLPKQVLSLIYREQWFRLFIPEYCNGKELALPSAVRMFEALAYTDANVGWCVNLGAGANIFAGYLQRKTAEKIFRSSTVCCAGSGAITGTAFKAKDGYILSGKWKYASGAKHATHFTANATLLNEKGKPLNDTTNFLSFIFPAKEVKVFNDWQPIGLKATSSNSFEVKNIFVPEKHTFSLLAPSEHAQYPIYKFPFLEMAVVNMTVMLTGMAIRFIELYNELAKGKRLNHQSELLKDNKTARKIYKKTTADFYQNREDLFRQLENVWSIYHQQKEAGSLQLLGLRKAAAKAAASSRTVVNELYPLCGMSILDTNTELNKVWRDFSVACLHYLVSPLL